jgi:hypothetical protein
MYFVINKQPVFLTALQYKQLRNDALDDKTPEFRIRSMMDGFKEAGEARGILLKRLNERYFKDPTSFYSKWVRFELIGDEASQNVRDLLNDYCDFYGHGYLSDVRPVTQRLSDDYHGDSFAYPMGKVFVLNHHVNPGRWWWRYTHIMSGRTIRLIIASKEVERIEGDLMSFTIQTKGFLMKCGQDLEIIPLASKFT